MNGTEKSQGPPEKDTPGKEQEGSTQSYTEEELKVAVNAALTAAGREAKAIKLDKEWVAAEKKRITDERVDWLRQKDEAELEAARSDPDEMTRVKREQRMRQQQQAAEHKDVVSKAREDAVAEREKVVQEQLSRLTAMTISAKYEGVSAEDLLNYAGDDPEKMEALAQKLSGKKPARMKLDSGATMGGGKGLTVDAVRGMSSEDIVRHAKEIAKLPLTI